MVSIILAIAIVAGLSAGFSYLRIALDYSLLLPVGRGLNSLVNTASAIQDSGVNNSLGCLCHLVSQHEKQYFSMLESVWWRLGASHMPNFKHRKLTVRLRVTLRFTH